MAWETRGGTAKYYTRSRRVNGRVVREYFGRGPEAEQAAREDELRQQQRRDLRRKLALEQQQRAKINQMLDRDDAFVDFWFRAEMLARGYHYHRGSWRKHRASKLKRLTEERERKEAEDREREREAESAAGCEREATQAIEHQRTPRRRPLPPRRSLLLRHGLVREVGYARCCARLQQSAARRVQRILRVTIRSVAGRLVSKRFATHGSRPRRRQRAGCGTKPRPPPVGDSASAADGKGTAS